MWNMLRLGSSPIDWCEENYTFLPGIAEAVNTFSNIVFIVIPSLLIHLFKEYGELVNPGIHVIWASFIVVGLSSAYFHATLSRFGQLLDELAILWGYFVAFSMLFPRRLYPNFVHNDRRLFTMASLTMGLAGTSIALILPAFNAIALMTLVIPSLIVLLQELKRQGNPRIQRLGLRCAITGILAVVLWLSDWFLCDTCFVIKYLYLHGWWHVLMCISAYTICVLFAYFAVKEETPERKAVLRYWPRNDFEFGIPYIAVKSHDHCGDI